MPANLCSPDFFPALGDILATPTALLTKPEPEPGMPALGDGRSLDDGNGFGDMVEAPAGLAADDDDDDDDGTGARASALTGLAFTRPFAGA